MESHERNAMEGEEMEVEEVLDCGWHAGSLESRQSPLDLDYVDRKLEGLCIRDDGSKRVEERDFRYETGGSCNDAAYPFLEPTFNRRTFDDPVHRGAMPSFFIPSSQTFRDRGTKVCERRKSVPSLENMVLLPSAKASAKPKIAMKQKYWSVDRYGVVTTEEFKDDNRLKKWCVEDCLFYIFICVGIGILIFTIRKADAVIS